MEDIKCLYWGVFVEDIDPVEPLDREIENKHITFGFKVPFPTDLLGEEIRIEVIGYGNDGYNEGFEVFLPEWCYEYYNGAEVPHITLSLAEGASAKDTADIVFEAIEPFFIEGVFGYCTFDNEVVVS